ncbi:MAG TPA: ribonuclease HII [Coriobacteriia bacterium]|nr:ribonuclease HII [Coriobacteriia bacterium]
MRDLTVAECRDRLARSHGVYLRTLIVACEHDPRSSVREAARHARRRLDREVAESRRLARLNELEDSLRRDGVMLIAGFDEVGRGALAGPVTAAAVMLPAATRIGGLTDSKRLSPSQRLRIESVIRSTAIATSVAHVPAHIIDALGVTAAIRYAMESALSSLDPPPHHVITDGARVGLPAPETPVVRGDGTVAAVAAASVVAKVARDALMVKLAEAYPHWSFEINKGYGTDRHLSAIRSFGLSPIHRRSFAPCAMDATPS